MTQEEELQAFREGNAAHKAQVAKLLPLKEHVKHLSEIRPFFNSVTEKGGRQGEERCSAWQFLPSLCDAGFPCHISMKNPYAFQYCQKLVLFNTAQTAVLLARRKGEADYSGVYSFIGGKLETTDGGFVPGLQREKDEEVGKEVKIRVCPILSYNAYFLKKDGSVMVLPHYYAIYQEGGIVLNEEYSDYKWVNLDELHTFEPKIETIEDAVQWALKIKTVVAAEHFVTI